MFRSLILTACALLGALTLRAQNPDSLAVRPMTADPLAAAPGDAEAESLWQQANRAYIAGSFTDALNGYEELLRRGYVSARLYYNAGNACFKTGRTGRAILLYNRALRLAPGDADIRHNLDVAASRTKDRIESVPEFFVREWIRSLRSSMSSDAWCAVSLALLALTLACAMLFLLSRTLAWRKAGFYATSALLLAFLLATSFAWAERRELLRRDEAVVLSSTLPVKAAPDRSATDLFVLHEGTKVRIENELDEWREIVIADGKKGWVDIRHIEII